MEEAADVTMLATEDRRGPGREREVDALATDVAEAEEDEDAWAVLVASSALAIILDASSGLIVLTPVGKTVEVKGTVIVIVTVVTPPSESSEDEVASVALEVAVAETAFEMAVALVEVGFTVAGDDDFTTDVAVAELANDVSEAEPVAVDETVERGTSVVGSAASVSVPFATAESRPYAWKTVFREVWSMHFTT